MGPFARLDADECYVFDFSDVCDGTCCRTIVVFIFARNCRTLIIGRIEMSDLTVYAEALISTVARAFYDDESVCLIDVLIRDKFLRDDDMAPRLHLSAKKLRATLQFLTEEHLVRSETVDDLAQGGSQATKFYYLDYNRAVHSIRLRLYLLRKQLEDAELQARSNSFYLCPGYRQKRCNGRYTEEESSASKERQKASKGRGEVGTECYV